MHNTPLRTLLSALLLLTAPLSSAGPLRDKLQEWRAERQAPHAQIQRDLAYGSDKQQRVDLYLPTNAQQAPVLLMVHGGSWRLGDKGAAAVVDNKVKRWLPKGFIFVSINYRLLPAAAPLEQADDVARALAFVQQQASGWGGDPRKIILIGHSAGAPPGQPVGGPPAARL